MTAQILDGKAALASIKQELAARVAALKEQGITPGLGTVLVGDDPGSSWYVAAKHKDCAEIGITSIRRDLPASSTLDEVLDVVRGLTGGRGPDAVIDAVGMEAHGSPVGATAHKLIGLLPDAIASPLMRNAGVDRMNALYSAIDLVRRGGTI